MTNQGWVRLMAIAAAAVVALSAAASADDIRIWPTAQVRTEAVTLGDIAEVSGPFVESAGLRSLVVHVAPQPGAEILIRVGDVREAMSATDASLASVNFVGSSGCRVSRPRLAAAPKPVVIAERKTPSTKKPANTDGRFASKRIRLADRGEDNATLTDDAPGARPKNVKRGAAKPAADGTLESALRGYIEAHAPTHAGKLDIRISGGDRRELDLSGSGYQFDVHSDDAKPDAGWLGLKSFRVDVIKDGAAQDPVAVVAEVALLQSVVVAKRPINRGQKIDSGSLRIEERRFDDIKKIGVTDLRTAVGQTTTEFIAADGLVMAKALSPAPIVKRGETVTIWRRGGVMIRLTGKAQGDGVLGSQIKVRRDGSRKNSELLDAVVTGPGTVELVDDSRMAARQGENE